MRRLVRRVVNQRERMIRFINNALEAFAVSQPVEKEAGVLAGVECSSYGGSGTASIIRKVGWRRRRGVQGDEGHLDSLVNHDCGALTGMRRHEQRQGRTEPGRPSHRPTASAQP